MRKIVLYAILFFLPFVSQGQTYGSNFLVSGTSTADSEYSGSYVASYAFDGNTATFWNSGAGLPHWIQYQIVGAKTLAKLITNKADGIYAKTLDVKGSNNGTDWNTLPPQVVSQNTDNLWETFYFNATSSYTYFRIEFSDAWSGTYSAMREIEMYELVEPSTSSSSFMSTSTDAQVGFAFQLFSWFLILGGFFLVAWGTKKLIKG